MENTWLLAVGGFAFLAVPACGWLLRIRFQRRLQAVADAYAEREIAWARQYPRPPRISNEAHTTA